MTSRELLASAMGIAGVASVTPIEAEPMPLCLVVKIDRDCECTSENAARIRADIAKEIGPNCPQIVILSGCSLEAVPRAMDIRAIVREVVREMSQTCQ